MTIRALPRRPAVRPPAPVPEVIPPPLGVRFGVEAAKPRTPVGFDPKAGQHLLVSGDAGSGKTTVLASLVQGSLVARCVVYVAAARSDHPGYALEQRQIEASGSGLAGSQRVLEAACVEMMSRQERMVEQNKRRYDRLFPPASPVLVVVDGVLELLAMDWQIGSPENMQRAAVGSMLDSIAQYGPKTGLSLMIASSEPAGTLVAVRLFPHLHDLGDTAARLTLHSADAPGRGLWMPVDQVPVEVQADQLGFGASGVTNRRTAARTG